VEILAKDSIPRIMTAAASPASHSVTRQRVMVLLAIAVVVLTAFVSYQSLQRYQHDQARVRHA